MIGGEATQLRFCAAFLEALGLSVMVAEDFRDGVRSLAEAKPRLVILDSRISGLDPVAWLRITDFSGVRPKIFVVTDAAIARSSGIMAPGVDGYLQRPIRSLDLVRAAELAAR